MKGTTLKIEPELTAQAAALFAELGMDHCDRNLLSSGIAVSRSAVRCASG